MVEKENAPEEKVILNNRYKTTREEAGCDSCEHDYYCSDLTSDKNPSGRGCTKSLWYSEYCYGNRKHEIL